MRGQKISFFTPYEYFDKNKLMLSKSYSQKLKINNNDIIYIASNYGRRDNQQDCIAIAQNNEYLLLLVADGMGGLSNGEIASYITAKIIKKWFETEDIKSLKYLDEKTFEDVLNALIYLISNKLPEESGSTLNMSIIGPTKTLIANVGDSRTYIVKDNKIILKTTDDSLVFYKYKPTTSEQRDKLRFHKKNNIITNSIAKHIFPNIKITSIDNKEYDIICHLTDGITDFLTEKEIDFYLEKNNPAHKLVKTSITKEPISSNIKDKNFNSKIYPGSDNSSAIVYSKKLTK